MIELNSTKKIQLIKDIASRNDVVNSQDVIFSINTLEQRVAELESQKKILMDFIKHSCYVFDGNIEDVSDSYIDALDSGMMPQIGD